MSSSPEIPTSTLRLPWKHRLMLRLGTIATNTFCRSDFTINRWLTGILDRRSPPSSIPIDGVSSYDLLIDKSRNLWVRIFTPIDDVQSLPVIFYYHGGGFAFSYADSSLYHTTAHQFAKQLRAVVISVNYRLAPEFRFPCQYDDGFDALKFIDEIDDGTLPASADLGRSFILGESAGGNLGHHVAVRASEYAFKKLKLIGFIATQPFFGAEERTESEIRLCNQPPLSLKLTDWFWKAFLPVGSDRDHAAANVLGPNGRDISGVEKFPATVVLVGGFDLLQDGQRRYYEGLKRMGKEVKMVELPNAIHGFFCFPDLPEYSSMIQAVRDFIAAQWQNCKKEGLVI
ncbi:probable carboxylesterase 18 [Cucurbita pepo subsp. pepo]|uniref:probable carboxylesterase 18 n=1 Tax=Cucurbita pepo subsp. pepo TaxID=3664 RepID=UPI000C9D3AD4|nr:probable carboxylesterase 18 [Cucurbita pepo subsp. pepo]